MSRRLRFTQEQVINALTKCYGLKAPAARALHCSRHTVTRYIERFPAIKEAQEDAIEGALDLAQSKLVDLVEKENFWAIRYLLSTLGKSRGFTTRQETVHVGYDMEEIRWQVREERHQQFLEDIRRVYGEED